MKYDASNDVQLDHKMADDAYELETSHLYHKNSPCRDNVDMEYLRRVINLFMRYDDYITSPRLDANIVNVYATLVEEHKPTPIKRLVNLSIHIDGNMLSWRR